jgi:hypothetical protein
LGFACSSFSRSWRYSICLFIWDLSVHIYSWLWTFLLGLPLLCPIGSDRLCFHFHYIPGNFWFHLLFLLWPHWWLSNVLFSL